MPTTFVGGTGDFAGITTLPAALLKAVEILDAAEQARNTANPRLDPSQTIAATFDLAGKVADISVVLPYTKTIGTNGAVTTAITDYLGSTYSAINDGGSDVGASTSMGAVFEIASRMVAYELAQTEATRPNFVQIEESSETGQLTITASLPVSSISGTAIDYV